MAPDGMVIWLAKRMPCTCCSEMPASFMAAGSSTMSRMGVGPPVRSTVETPSMPCSEGSTSVRAIWAASVGSAPSTGPMVATTMGWLLKSNELTCGSLPCGRSSWRTACSTSVSVSLRSVPKSNSAKTSDSELPDVDCTVCRRGTLEMACSTGTVTCSATSSAPAPGTGVMMVTKGNSISGSSSWRSWFQEKMPARSTPTARRMMTLFSRMANCVRRIMRSWSFRSGRRQGRRAGGVGPRGRARRHRRGGHRARPRQGRRGVGASSRRAARACGRGHGRRQR